MSGLTFLSVSREERAFRLELEQQARLLVGSLAASSTYIFFNLDTDFLSEMLVVIGRDRLVVSARVYDAKGRIVADARDSAVAFSMQADPFGRRLVRSRETILEWQSDQLLAGRAVVTGDRQVGAVSVGLSTAPLKAKIAALRFEGFGAALLAAGLGMAMALLVTVSITRPLIELTRATARVAGGDLNQRIIIRGHDEIAVLAEGFNGMLTQLRETMEGLEERIRERTQALQASEEAFRAASEAASEAIVSSNTHGDITYVNSAAERIFGYAASALIGRPVTTLMPDRSRRAYWRRMERFQATGGSSLIGRTTEHRGKRKDGAEFPIELSLANWKTAQGTFFTAIIRDITERKQAEERVYQAKEEAERANRAKSEFLSRTSHELRTPLNAILGFAQLLEMDDLSPEQRESVNHILRGGSHLLALINEVLDIARIETGRLAVSAEPVSVRDVVSESLQMVTPLAGERHVGLEGNLDKVPEPFMVMANQQRLKQVILNLLVNAVKYNRVGGSVSFTYQQDADTLRISVTDTGPGIAPEKLQRIFTPFDRLGAEHSLVEGTGLGLALSKHLVEAMKGTLGVESTVGVGSTFWVELALARRPAELPSPMGARPSVPSEGAGRPRVVLYIEERLSDLPLLQNLLARRPHLQLLSAGQGRAGLKLAREHPPHLILLDEEMPDMPLEEFIARLPAILQVNQVPVVVITNDPASPHLDRLLAIGVHGCLTRPLDVGKFMALLDDALADREATPA